MQAVLLLVGDGIGVTAAGGMPVEKNMKIAIFAKNGIRSISILIFKPSNSAIKWNYNEWG